MRLIDADSTYLQDAIGRNAFKTRDDIRALIDRAPTVNAVIVTRCKDCRYRGLICCPAIHETIGNGLVDYAVDNGYCWCGKPKET